MNSVPIPALRPDGQLPVLEARELSKVYRMGEVDVHALRGVDFELHQGELLVLLGASGSGKSTLLNILGGLDVPTSGQVRYRASARPDRTPTRRRSPATAAHHVGFVFQFYNLIPSLTARENVALVTEIAADRWTPRRRWRWSAWASACDHFPAQLSGGEQQRVAIARAVAKRPRRCCCATSPPARSTIRTGDAGAGGDRAREPASWVRPPPSSPTTPPSPPWPTGW